MASHRLAKHTFDDLEVLGYSVGGEETVVIVPSLDVCFDIGKAPDQALSINNVFLSHGHMDHAAGIAYYCSQRDFREMAPGTVYLPASLAPAVQQLLDCWGRLDGSRPPANVIPVQPGQEFEIRRNLFACAFRTNHGSPSLGYSIVERRKKLKAQYLDLPGPEIAKLRKAGTEITYTIEIPLVTYLGDTMAGEFQQLPCVRHSRILITECTFFDPDHRARARAGRHYHFEDLARVLPAMENQYILLTHLSRRTELVLARQAIDQLLPPEIAQRVHFLMAPARRRPPRPPTND